MSSKLLGLLAFRPSRRSIGHFFDALSVEQKIEVDTLAMVLLYATSKVLAQAVSSTGLDAVVAQQCDSRLSSLAQNRKSES